MIVTLPNAIPRELADKGRQSLDEQINRIEQREDLSKSRRTILKLEWTNETTDAIKVARNGILDRSILREQLETLGYRDVPEDLRNCLTRPGPMMYIENSEAPITFPRSYPHNGAIGVVALGALKLPEIGESGTLEIESGTIALFRSDAPITYRSCGWGRGIMFFIDL
ncbi:hypothetical protein BDV97DRAFT_398577 [Delphinella strobiligena]|nr:hypothetical protein BDV97DRAFT_398577 [Delphinella strobiligena]